MRRRWFWVELFGGGRLYPGCALSRSARARAGYARALPVCAQGCWHLGDAELGARRAEQAERAGRGGAERSAEQPLPASADPSPRPGSMDRSSLLQLIQEQVRGGWELALPWRPSSR